MAFASAGTFGTNSSTTSGTTLTLTPSQTLQVGNLAVVIIAADNDGQNIPQNDNGHFHDLIISVTDTGSNTWVCIGSNSDVRAANNGTAVQVFASKITTQLTTGSTITATLQTAKTSKAITGWEFTMGAGSFHVAELRRDYTEAADPQSMTIGDLPSAEYLFLRATATETTNTSWTPTASFTGFTNATASTGAGATSMSADGEFIITTATGATSDPTKVAADTASVFIAISEAIPPYPVLIHGGIYQQVTTGATVPWPRPHEVDDICLIVCETAGGEAVTLTTANGFAHVNGSPQNTSETQLTAFWCRATSRSMASPVLADPGNHLLVKAFLIRGCIATGNPWDVSTGTALDTPSTSVSIAAITTTVANTLVMAITSIGTDSVVDQFSNFANATLAQAREAETLQTDVGTGGGFGVGIGRKATTGSTGASTWTLATTSDHAKLHIAWKPVVGVTAVGKELSLLWDNRALVGDTAQLVWDTRAKFTNTFEGGSDGTTITTGNSGGTSGRAFDGVTLSGGGTLVYDDDAGISEGTFSARADASTAIGDAAYVYWNTGTVTEAWYRTYFQSSDVTPASEYALMQSMSGGLSAGGIWMAVNGKLALRDSGNNVRYTSTATLADNTPYRIELHIVHSATLGHIEARLFYGSNLHGTSPDESFGNLTDNWNMRANGDQIRFGIVDDTSTVLTSWFDALGFSNETWLGPAVTVVAVGKELSVLWDDRFALGDTIQALWDIRYGLGDTSQLVWDIRAAIGDTTSLVWDLQANIGDAVQALWDIQYALGDTVTLRWDQFTTISDTVSALWDQYTVIGDSVQALWDISATAGDTVEALWDIQYALSDTSTLRWDLQANIQDNLSLVWDQYTTLDDSVSLVWDQFTTIEDTTSLLWDIRGSVGQEIETIWNVRSSIGDTVSLLWDQHEAVGDAVELLWDIAALTAIGDEITLLWDQYVAVSDTLDLAWDQHTVIGDAVATLWDIQAAVGEQVAIRWDVFSAVGDLLALVWDQHTVIGDSVQIVWDQTAAVGDNVSLQWDALAAVSDSLSLLWDQLAAVSDEVSSVWDIRAAVGDSVDLLWDIAGEAVFKAVALLWDIFVPVEDSIELQWDQFTAISDSVDFQWDVAESVGDAVELVWDSIGPISRAIDLRWDILEASGEDLIVRWDVLKEAFKEISMIWDLSAQLAAQFEVRWDVLSASSKDLEARWDIRTTVADQVALSWDIKALVSDSVALLWDVRVPVSDSVQLVWDTTLAYAVGRGITLLWFTQQTFDSYGQYRMTYKSREYGTRYQTREYDPARSTKEYDPARKSREYNPVRKSRV